MRLEIQEAQSHKPYHPLQGWMVLLSSQIIFVISGPVCDKEEPLSAWLLHNVWLVMSPYSERKDKREQNQEYLFQSSEGQNSSQILPKQSWILEEEREVCVYVGVLLSGLWPCSVKTDCCQLCVLWWAALEFTYSYLFLPDHLPSLVKVFPLSSESKSVFGMLQSTEEKIL